jgi:hypothetical protein
MHAVFIYTGLYRLGGSIYLYMVQNGHIHSLRTLYIRNRIYAIYIVYGLTEQVARYIGLYIYACMHVVAIAMDI